MTRTVFGNEGGILIRVRTGRAEQDKGIFKRGCTICTSGAYYPHVDYETGSTAYPANGQTVSRRAHHRCEADGYDVAVAAALPMR